LADTFFDAGRRRRCRRDMSAAALTPAGWRSRYQRGMLVKMHYRVHHGE
jgi:hypothetical protein